MATYQASIVSLTGFWGEQGCVVLPPIDVEVGTGTMVPDVFLRLLGPEPWRGVLLQASRRPWDGRFAENTLRVGKHDQLQVILKPPAAGARDLFLDSLRAAGLDLAVHDLRFLPEQWRVRNLGVRGSGWQVRLDGVKIAHFVYLQEAAGRVLDPVSLEISYGVERLALLEQGVTRIDDIVWADGVSYGEVRQRSEEDFSQYYFGVADPELVQDQLEACVREAQRCLAEDLVLPAYELVLKASHLLQILVFRGGVAAPEEEEFRQRLLEQASACGERYVSRREKLGFPLLGGTA